MKWKNHKKTNEIYTIQIKTNKRIQIKLIKYEWNVKNTNENYTVQMKSYTIQMENLKKKGKKTLLIWILKKTNSLEKVKSIAFTR